MYGSYQDVLKRSARFTPEGVPVWPLTIHTSDSDRHPKGHDRHGHGAKHESAGRVSGIGIGGKDAA